MIDTLKPEREPLPDLSQQERRDVLLLARLVKAGRLTRYDCEMNIKKGCLRLKTTNQHDCDG